MIRAMLDIETLASVPNAAIAQVGAVRFDLKGREIGDPFLRNVQLTSALKYGVADGKTLAWWLQQSDEARLGLLRDPEPEPLPIVLGALHKWWSTKHEGEGIGECWSHATFDAVVLLSAYRALGRHQPFAWKHVHDLRTLFSMCPPGKVERVGIHHNALDDCRHQVTLAVRALQRLS